MDGAPLCWWIEINRMGHKASSKCTSRWGKTQHRRSCSKMPPLPRLSHPLKLLVLKTKTRLWDSSEIHQCRHLRQLGQYQWLHPKNLAASPKRILLCALLPCLKRMTPGCANKTKSISNSASTSLIMSKTMKKRESRRKVTVPFYWTTLAVRTYIKGFLS